MHDCLDTHIIQNINFCIQQEKNSYRLKNNFEAE